MRTDPLLKTVEPRFLDSSIGSETTLIVKEHENATLSCKAVASPTTNREMETRRWTSNYPITLFQRLVLESKVLGKLSYHAFPKVSA